MPRLVLVNPISDPVSGIRWRKITQLPPLGLAYLGAVTPPHWEITLMDENVRVASFPDADFVGSPRLPLQQIGLMRLPSSIEARTFPWSWEAFT